MPSRKGDDGQHHSRRDEAESAQRGKGDAHRQGEAGDVVIVTAQEVKEYAECAVGQGADAYAVHIIFALAPGLSASTMPSTTYITADIS